MSNHTPGPWEIDHMSGDIAVCKGQYVIVYTSEGAHNAEANIRLVSASPELLKALIDLYNVSVTQLDQSATHDGLTNCNALAQARAAIERAGG